MKSSWFHLILSITLLSFFGLSCETDVQKCFNEHFTETASPDGEFKAVVFHRRCGEADFIMAPTHVSVVRRDESLPRYGGNIVEVEYGGLKVSESTTDNSKVEARWTEKKELKLIHPAKAVIKVKAEEIEGITIIIEGRSG